MSSDLIEFLRARLDEDEQTAKRAATRERGGESWRLVGEHESEVRSGGGVGVVPRTPPVFARHIARHAPARVLREVEAKRRIVELHGPLQKRATGSAGGTIEDCRTCDHFPAQYPCTTLRLLALPYADHHPDYREEWRP